MITINVTKRDIENSKTERCTECPVALAINRRLKKKHWCAVLRDCGNLWCGAVSRQVLQRFVWPDKVRQFIKDFDALESVNPIRFKLDITKKYLK